MLRFQGPPDVSPQDVGCGCMSEPQRDMGSAGVRKDTQEDPRWSSDSRQRSNFLARNCASSLSLTAQTGSQLRMYFRVPERANSRRDNHPPATAQTDFSALQPSLSRISALAVFPSPREDQQYAGQSCTSLNFKDFSALQTSPSRISALAVFPSPREDQQ